MADAHRPVDVASSSNGSSDAAPNHLNTNIESGQFDEKAGATDNGPVKKPEEDEEEDEDMDALIDELESQDGHIEDEEGEDDATPGAGRVVPEDQLQTDTRIGLTDAEVHARRKKYGMNQMKEEKENLILKFLGYFIGPIQFVMEVRWFSSNSANLPVSTPPKQAPQFSDFLYDLHGFPRRSPAIPSAILKASHPRHSESCLLSNRFYINFWESYTDWSFS
jgi:hypothetical protein